VIYKAATNGLGRHQDDLSPGLFEIYAKNYYVANLLFILTLAFAKASLVFLIVRLSPVQNTRRICYALLALVALWAIIYLFLFAFQCSLPRPWDNTSDDTCNISISGLYYSFSATDMVTDLLVTLLPAYVIWNVQIPLRKRIAVIAVFGSRILSIVFMALRTAYLSQYINTPTDRSWEATTPQTWTQIVQCIAIITACVPCLKPFLESLESGFMDLSLTHHTGATYGNASSGSNGHRGVTASKSAISSKNKSNVESFAMDSFGSNNANDDHDVDGDDLNHSHHHQHRMRSRGMEKNLDRDIGIADGRYLDTDQSPVRPSAGGRRVSATESERALTAKSSTHSDEVVRDDGRGFSFGDVEAQHRRAGSRGPGGGVGGGNDGIRVTKEVEIRNEGSFDGRGLAGTEDHVYGSERRRW
jgi:hypothetical protein